MSLKLSVIPATAVAIAPTDLLYLAKDMGAGVWLEHKLPVSVLNAAYQAAGNFLPLAGGTMSGAILFSPDATVNIGAAGATRPQTIFLGTSVNLALSSQAAIRPNGTLEYGGVDIKFTDAAFRRKLSQRVASTVAVKAVSTWTSRVSAADNAWYDIAWSPELGLFAAVSDGGAIGTKVQTSPDGITWTSRTAAVNNGWLGIAWSPQLGLFAAVAYDGGGNQVMTSPDGITWTARVAAINNDWVKIAWSPELGLFAAVSDSGVGNRVMTSPDGITWTSRTSAADIAWLDITWSPELGIFVAVANGGVGNGVMTSPDGITWTSRTPASDRYWDGVAWSPELGIFAAVAASGVAAGQVMTSPDGITWTSRTSAAAISWTNIVWSPELGQFAAVANSGTGNRVMTSPDGITWTTRVSASDTTWYGLAWAPELGIFAATSGSGASNRVMTSGFYGSFRTDQLKLSLAGGTLSGGLTFSPDCTLDIGATGASRPRTIYLCTSAIIQRSALGVTAADGLQLVNSTAAAAGAQQFSSSIRLTGQGWKTNATAASQAVDWRMTNRPVQGAANPTSDLLFDFSVNGGAFATKLCLSSAGVVELPNGTDPGADPATAGAQWVASGEWQYRTSAASEGAGQTNRVHNRGVTVNGAGTDYSLTTATARVDFGTTDPEVVLPTAGTYLLLAKVVFLGGVGTVNDSVTVKFRNSTDATDIGSSSLETVIANGLRTSLSLSAVVTVTASKTIQLFAFNFIAARGSIESSYTNISYVRLY